MSNPTLENEKEKEGRRIEAEHLRSEVADVVARLEIVAEDLGRAEDPDLEKMDQMGKGEELAQQALSKLEFGEAVPLENTLADVRELIEAAKMHTNEAEPAFPAR